MILPEVVQETAKQISSKLPRKLSDMFNACYGNTLLTATELLEDGTAFIITGDIAAMWLRDSSQQVYHYMDIAKKDKTVANVIEGLIRRQVMYINIDPYANAFNKEPNDNGHKDDITDRTPWIWERKYEIDSLCHPLRLAYSYWKETGRDAIFDEALKNAIHRIINLWKKEQHHKEQSSYHFERKNCLASDTLVNGVGTEVGFTGMTWSGFRSSDDACIYGYNVPENMFAVTVLRYVEEIARVVYQDPSLEKEAKELRLAIDEGIRRFGIYDHPKYGKIYAYEVDGLGHYNLMDDANVPGLLSIPYFGYADASDELYQNTRKFVLSSDNPYYFEGKCAKGLGSAHTPEKYIWHIGLIIQGLTSNDRKEMEEVIRTLQNTDAGTGHMHEGFLADDPNIYTREWFTWADSVFCELILRLVK